MGHMLAAGNFGWADFWVDHSSILVNTKILKFVTTHGPGECSHSQHRRRTRGTTHDNGNVKTTRQRTQTLKKRRTKDCSHWTNFIYVRTAALFLSFAPFFPPSSSPSLSRSLPLFSPLSSCCFVRAATAAVVRCSSFARDVFYFHFFSAAVFASFVRHRKIQIPFCFVFYY